MLDSGILYEQIQKETPLTYKLIKSYQIKQLTYVVLSTEIGCFLARKPSSGERLRDFEKSTRFILPDYSFFIVLCPIPAIDDADILVTNLNSIITEREEL